MDVVRALLGSKKFVTTMIGMIVSIAAHLGLDPVLAATIASVVVKCTVGFVVAQGVADFGKEKVLAEAAVSALLSPLQKAKLPGSPRAKTLGSPPV